MGIITTEFIECPLYGRHGSRHFNIFEHVFFLSQQPFEIGAVIISILGERRVRCQETKQLAECHKLVRRREKIDPKQSGL